MDRNNPAPVKAADIVKKIEDLLSSLQNLAQSEQQPCPSTLVKKLTVETKGLQTEMDDLSTKIRPHFKILKDIHQDTYTNHHQRGESMDGGTRMELLLCWSYIIEGILTDFALLTTSTISSVSSTLKIVLSPFLTPPSPVRGNKQTRTVSQKRLNTVFESALSSSKALSFSIAKLKDDLFDLATTTIPHASSEATRYFTDDLLYCCHHPLRDSFPVALKSTRKLIRLVVKMLLLGPEEGTEMNQYGPKINILLRVLENYFYRHPSRRRYNLFGNLEPEKTRGGFPVAPANMFQTEEIGGVLAGLAGTCIVLKIGAAKSGFSIKTLGAVEGRMKMLKRCLEIMWGRELAFISKVEWMKSPQRIVRNVRRKADRTEEEEEDAAPKVAPKSTGWEAHTAKDGKPSTDGPTKRDNGLGTRKIPTGKNGSQTAAPNNEEARTANMAFRTGKVPATPGNREAERTREESVTTSTLDQAEINTRLGAERKKKKRKKGGRKHRGGKNG